MGVGRIGRWRVEEKEFEVGEGVGGWKKEWDDPVGVFQEDNQSMERMSVTKGAKGEEEIYDQVIILLPGRIFDALL